MKMTINEAQENLNRWRKWEEDVKSRWEPDSPLVRLAHRRVLEAELRYLTLVEQE